MIVLLTGATDGIGKEAAYMFARQGAELLMHGKRNDTGIELRDKVIKETGNPNIHYYNADLADINEIGSMCRQIRAKFPKLDILVNNAGIYEKERIILPNGIEKTFMVNHLGPFYLSLNLIDMLKASDSARVVNVSSMVHAASLDPDNLNGEKYYSGDNAYSLSKLCNILFTNKLSRELEGTGITVNSMHPGVLNTKVLRTGWGAIGGSPAEGAKRIFLLAYSKELDDISGQYFMNDRAVRARDISYDKDTQDNLWRISKQLTGL